jgi:predicted nucleic acid-binding protein
VPFILDASIVGCWCFHDEHDARADVAWDRLERGRESALVPTHWWFEVRNILLLGERRGRVTEAYSGGFLQRLERFAIERAGLPDQVGVFAIARKHRLTFYDAAYLELAKREGLALATLDNELEDAARAEQVPLVKAAV